MEGQSNRPANTPQPLTFRRPRPNPPPRDTPIIAYEQVLLWTDEQKAILNKRFEELWTGEMILSVLRDRFGNREHFNRAAAEILLWDMYLDAVCKEMDRIKGDAAEKRAEDELARGLADTALEGEREGEGEGKAEGEGEAQTERK